jgi:hypothetical protein
LSLNLADATSLVEKMGFQSELEWRTCSIS